MGEKNSNIGRQLLKTLLERNYSDSTVDSAAGMSIFLKDSIQAKKELLNYLNENPNATDNEVFQEIAEIRYRREK